MLHGTLLKFTIWGEIRQGEAQEMNNIVKPNNSTKKFYTKWWFWVLVGGVTLLLLLMIIAIAVSSPRDSLIDDYLDMSRKDRESRLNRKKETWPNEKIDVNGLVIKEACAKVREKGWLVNSVSGLNSGHVTEKSDCSDSNRKVMEFTYRDDKEYYSSPEVILYFASDKVYVEQKKDKQEPSGGEVSPTTNKNNQPEKQEPKSSESNNKPADVSSNELRVFCESQLEALGVPGAKISMKQAFPSPGIPDTYTITGTLSQKTGLTHKRQQLGSVHCQINHKNMVVKELNVNGRAIL